MALYWQIFLTFAKIGAFTLGGGYAMISLIQREVVDKYQWISKDDFIDMIAVSQALPGILSVNIAIFTGYRLKGNKGSIVATLGTILPSFFIILAIAVFFRQFEDNIYIQKMFKTIRPAVVALIAVPVFTTARQLKINFQTVIIPVASAFLIWYWGVSPVFIVLVAVIGGVLYGIFFDKKRKISNKNK